MESFLYIVNRIFLPPKLPQEDDDQGGIHSQALCIAVHESLKRYISGRTIAPHQVARWNAMSKMIENLCKARPASKDCLKRTISTMNTGGLFDSLLNIHGRNSQ